LEVSYSDSEEDDTYTYLTPIVECPDPSCSYNMSKVLVYAIYINSVGKGATYDANVRQASAYTRSILDDYKAVSAIASGCPQLDTSTTDFALVQWKANSEAINELAGFSRSLLLAGTIAPSGIFFIIIVVAIVISCLSDD